jgi:acyl carrier protein
MGLDTIETVLWAENEFGIALKDEETSGIHTVGEFTALIHQKLVMRDDLRAQTETQVFNRLKAFLVTYFKMQPERINWESKFIKDLGMQ